MKASRKKHTPGPWEIWDQTFIGDDSTQGVQTADGLVIALCDEAHQTPRSQRVANAHLIAAAPELLGTLRHAYENLAAIIIENADPQTFTGILVEIREAIAKAEGS